MYPCIPYCVIVGYGPKKSLKVTTLAGFPGGLVVKNPSANAGDTGDGFDPWVGKVPWRKKWQPIPVFLPGKFHTLKTLMGYSPRGRVESDTTERLNTAGV